MQVCVCVGIYNILIYRNRFYADQYALMVYIYGRMLRGHILQYNYIIIIYNISSNKIRVRLLLLLFFMIIIIV